MAYYTQENDSSSEDRFLIRTHRNKKTVDIFEVLEENYCQPRILYPINISFKNEVKIEIGFQTRDKQENSQPIDLVTGNAIGISLGCREISHG